MTYAPFLQASTTAIVKDSQAVKAAVAEAAEKAATGQGKVVSGGAQNAAGANTAQAVGQTNAGGANGGGVGQTSVPTAGQTPAQVSAQTGEVGTAAGAQTSTQTQATTTSAQGSATPVTEAAQTTAGQGAGDATGAGTNAVEAAAKAAEKGDLVQEAAKPDPAFFSEAGLQNTLEMVQRFLETGGPVVVLLVVMSVVALAIIVSKMSQFAAMRVGRHKKGRRAIDLWNRGRVDEAYQMVEKHRSPVSVVLAHAMRGKAHFNLSDDILREDLERVAMIEVGAMQRRLRPLEAIAQIAPLIGLFGTVIGMIDAFQSLQSEGAGVDPSVLAGGIWVALLTTAVGLGVAIPASLAMTWLEGRVEREQAMMEQVLTAFFTRCATDRARLHALAETEQVPGQTLQAEERLVHAS